MGRPEWVLVGLVLSVGLIGVVVPAGAGSAHAAVAPASVEPIDTTGSTVSDVAGTGTLAGVTGSSMPLAVQQDRFPTPAQQEFERSSFRVTVDADGDAHWQFRYARPIESDDDRAAFERYAERFRTEETAFFRDFRNRSASLTSTASATTGREMAARNVTRDAGIEQTPTQEEGYVVLGFEWTNFGRVEGDTVVVGDVFEGGLYLGASQTLIFVAGDGVAFDAVEPRGAPSNGTLESSRSVSWTGERQFADRRPRVVYRIQGSGGGSDEGASMLWLVGGGVIGLILVTVLVRTRYGGLPGRDGGDAGASGGGAAAEESTADATPDADEPAAEPEEPASPPPEQPVSDDELVTDLLEDSGGRMKQTAIVEETEWSKSKVSMLLSEMEDEGRIKKIQVGRENIIALDGHEPAAASSPFDDTE